MTQHEKSPPRRAGDERVGALVGSIRDGSGCRGDADLAGGDQAPNDDRQALGRVDRADAVLDHHDNGVAVSAGHEAAGDQHLAFHHPLTDEVVGDARERDPHCLGERAVELGTGGGQGPDAGHVCLLWIVGAGWSRLFR